MVTMIRWKVERLEGRCFVKLLTQWCEYLSVAIRPELRLHNPDPPYAPPLISLLHRETEWEPRSQAVRGCWHYAVLLQFL